MYTPPLYFTVFMHSHEHERNTRQCVAQLTHDPCAHLALHCMYVQAQGKRTEAIEYFKHATELDPLFADAHFNLGLELLSAGRHHLARRSVSQ